MIITCPSCFAKYQIPNGSLSANGRFVRCASCDMQWTAYPGPGDELVEEAAEEAGATDIEGAALDVTMREVGDAVRDAVGQYDLTSEGDAEVFDAEDDSEFIALDTELEADDDTDGEDMPDQDDGDGLDDSDAGAHADGAVDMDDEDLIIDIDDDFDEDEDYMTRKRLQELDRDDRERGRRRRKFVTIGFGVWLIAVIGLIATLIFAKPTVVEKFPGMNQLYDFAAELRDYSGLGGDGDLPSFVEPKPIFLEISQNGRPRTYAKGGDNWIEISGTIKNLGEQSVRIESLIGVIRDSDLTPLDEWQFEPASSLLGRGAVLEFQTEYGPLPAGAGSLRIDVLLSSGKRYSDIETERVRAARGQTDTE